MNRDHHDYDADLDDIEDIDDDEDDLVANRCGCRST